ncbi:MAG: PAS domain S-box protein [bacterium]|nr:PAS domain S-box protein [bacterium]
MNLYSYIAFFVTLVYLGLGYSLYRQDKKSQLYRVFFFLCMVFAFWVFCFAFYISVKTARNFWSWYELSSLGWCMMPSLFLHFVFLLSKRQDILKKTWTYFTLYLPSLILFYRSLTSHILASGFIPEKDFNIIILSMNDDWIWAFLLYFHLFSILSIVLLFLWSRRTPDELERKQARIILLFSVITVALGMIPNIILPAMGIYHVPAMAPLITVFWIIGIYYSLVHFRTRVITTGIASDEIISNMNDLLILLDPNNNIIKINDQVHKLLGYREDELINTPFSSIIMENDALNKVLKMMPESRVQHYNGESYLVTRTKEYIPVNVSLTGMSNRNTGFLGTVILARDLRNVHYIKQLQEEVAKRIKVETEVEELKRQIEFILGSTKVNLDIIDADYNLIYVDPEWKKSYGDLAGRKCYEYFMGKQERCGICGIDQALKTKSIQIYEQNLVKENNRIIRVTTLPYQNDKGEWLVAEVNVDITDMKKAEDTLRESEERYRRLVELAPDAIVVHSQGKVVFINMVGVRLFGFKNAEECVGQPIYKFVHQESHDLVQERVRQMLEEKQAVPLVEEKFIRKDGSLIDVEVAAGPLVYQGKPSIQVVFRDITERKNMEEERKHRIEMLLYHQKSLYELSKLDFYDFENSLKKIAEACATTLNTDRLGIWFLNPGQTELHCGDLFLKDTNRHEQEQNYTVGVFNKYFKVLYHQHIIMVNAEDELSKHYHDIIETFMTPFDVKSIMIAPFWFQEKIVGIITLEMCKTARVWSLEEQEFAASAAEIISLVLVANERKKAEEQLRFISLHDPLTGLFNRAYFEEQLKGLYEAGNEDAIGIIVCDIDGLKIINDTLGHDKGDMLLLGVKRVLRNSIRPDDIPARVGGDEFAVLLNRTSKEEVENICHRIRDEVGLYNKEKLELPLSLSVGYAISLVSGKDMVELFKEADNNMYREKLHHRQSLRNAIVQTLMKALEERDFITEGHADRLQKIVEDLANAIRLPEQKIADLKLLAQFHDIGKVGISDRILFKPGPLTKEEYEEMKRHPEIGNRIALSSADLTPIADWILKHQEWWNGKGYPLGLSGEDIPLEARILAIADAFDAMTSDRPYRKAMPKKAAIDEIQRNAGIQFDPALVNVFITLLKNE